MILQRMHLKRVTGALLLTVCLTVYGETNYTVKANDTIYSLSREWGVSEEVLMAANAISDPTKLRVGQKIIVPSHHTVKSGDTLSEIALSYHMTLGQLLTLNQALSEKSILRIGQKIRVAAPVEPPKQPPIAIAAPKNQSPGGGSRNYYWPHPGDRQKISGRISGVSFAGETGDNLYSICSGKVVWVSPYQGYNILAIVKNDSNLFYFYGGSSQVYVSKGDYVQAGTRIGKLGPTPLTNKTQAFLFVYNQAGKSLDPLSAPRD